MRHRFHRLVAIGLILSIAACGGSDGPTFTWLRVMHAIPDAPTVRVSFEDQVLRRDVTFASSTEEAGEGLLDDSGNASRMTAIYLGPSGSPEETFVTADVPLLADSTSTVIFTGSFDNPEFFTVVTPRLRRPLAALYVQFAHGAPDLGAVDVYVTAPDTELTATAPLTTVQPQGHSETIEIPFGATRIRLTSPGSLDVLYDTGTLDFGESASRTGPGTQWLFTVMPSVIPGPSPALLIGSNGIQSFQFVDTGTPAAVRAVHAIAAAPPVDVVAATDPPETLFSGLAYRERSPLLAALPGATPLQFVVSPGAELIAEILTGLLRGQEYALFLIGPADDALILLNTSQTRSIANQSRLRFANLAPDSKFFSVYLADNEEAERDPATLAIRDLRFGQSSNHITRSPGDYFLTITERFYETSAEAADAEETVVLGPMPVTLGGGDVLTYALFAPDAEGEPEVLIQFDDKMP
jgi:hypothetical protein